MAAATQAVDVRIRIVFDIDQRTADALQALGWTPPENWTPVNEAAEQFSEIKGE